MVYDPKHGCVRTIDMPELPAETSRAEAQYVAESGARRSAGTPDYSLVPPVLLRIVAERFTLGVPKYGKFNWQKGFPFSNILDHMQSHLLKFREGSTMDEGGEPEGDLENLAAIAWGVSVLAWYIERGMGETLDDRAPWFRKDR